MEMESGNETGCEIRNVQEVELEGSDWKLHFYT